MDLQKVVNECTELLQVYHSDQTDIQDHVNQFIKIRQDLNNEERSFIMDISAGCVRYSQIVSVVLNGFFHMGGKNIRRTEHNIYQVLTYIIIFRLNDIDLDQLRRVLFQCNLNNMLAFLSCLLDEKNIVTWMQDGWNRCYDSDFVQSSLVDPLLYSLPELDYIVNDLRNAVSNKRKTVRRHHVTEPEPFNLTDIRPRKIPVPEPIPKMSKAKPVPKTAYIEPKEQKVLTELKAETKTKLEDIAKESSRQPPPTSSWQQEKKQQRMQAIIDAEEGKLKFAGHKAKPMPKNVNDSYPIRLNAAAILREENLYKKREDEIYQRLQRLEAGEGDETAFREWQTKMRKQDTDQRLLEIEQRRLEGKLSQEEAVLARYKVMHEKREQAAEMKEQAQKLMDEYLREKMEYDERMKGLVKSVTDSHENAKEAKKKKVPTESLS